MWGEMGTHNRLTSFCKPAAAGRVVSGPLYHLRARSIRAVVRMTINVIINLRCSVTPCSGYKRAGLWFFRN